MFLCVFVLICRQCVPSRKVPALMFPFAAAKPNYFEVVGQRIICRYL